MDTTNDNVKHGMSKGRWGKVFDQSELTLKTTQYLIK